MSIEINARELIESVIEEATGKRQKVDFSLTLSTVFKGDYHVFGQAVIDKALRTYTYTLRVIDPRDILEMLESEVQLEPSMRLSEIVEQLKAAYVRLTYLKSQKEMELTALPGDAATPGDTTKGGDAT